MYFVVGESILGIIFPGLPITMLLDGTSKFTKAPGATNTLSPIRISPIAIELAKKIQLSPMLGTPILPPPTAK